MSNATQKEPNSNEDVFSTAIPDNIFDSFEEFKGEPQEKQSAKPKEKAYVEYSLEDSQEDSNKGRFLAYLFLLIVLVGLIFGGGYYFLTQPSGEALLSKAQEILGFQTQPNLQNGIVESQREAISEFAKEEEIKRLQEALYQKEKELATLSQSVDSLSLSVKEMQNANSANSNTMARLRYTIKPKKQIITECFSMGVGTWEIPQSCLLSIATKVDKELQADKRVVAFEVQGIVDTNPYRGLSPELKQEGLASFRAWNAIRAINAKIPNATVFEGPSLQLENKRGYSIKAYFVE
ncbi:MULTISPECIES: hypothetical protein [Helicobacter]|uniref:hypothetical protein n=1 Tax=Helicobacter TaxID=209 RepID=UPI002614219A|nr:hypothetical protein [Helicobacter sp. UBA3407]